MAHFLGRAAATTSIRAAATTPALHAASSPHPSSATARRLAHTEVSLIPPLVPPEVRSELNRVEEDMVRRHREFAGDLAKLHKKVTEDYSMACRDPLPTFRKVLWGAGDPLTTFRKVLWGAVTSTLMWAATISFGSVTRSWLSFEMKEMRVEVEANLENVVAEKIGVTKAQAFVATE